MIRLLVRKTCPLLSNFIDSFSDAFSPMSLFFCKPFFRSLFRRGAFAMAALPLALAACASSQSAPEEGAFRPLWNGDNLAGWHAVGGGAWQVEDGVLTGRNAGEADHGVLATDALYDDFTMRLEFKSLEGNSGLYFRVEEVDEPWVVEGVQAEVAPEPAANVGGLYETAGRKWLVKPDVTKVRSYFRPGEWNRMKVRAKGGDLTVWVNGTRSAHVEGDQEGRRRGRIGLQVHGNQQVDVRFRNIEIKGEPVDASSASSQNGKGIRITGRLDENGKLLVNHRYDYEYEVVEVDQRE